MHNCKSIAYAALVSFCNHLLIDLLIFCMIWWYFQLGLDDPAVEWALSRFKAYLSCTLLFGSLIYSVHVFICCVICPQGIASCLMLELWNSACCWLNCRYFHHTWVVHLLIIILLASNWTEQILAQSKELALRAYPKVCSPCHFLHIAFFV